MSLAVCVIGDGRGGMLRQTVQSIQDHVAYPIHARIMVDDTGDADYGRELDMAYPLYWVVHGGRRGMAGAVQAGFDAVLDFASDYVLWVEEDHLLIRDLPVAQAIAVLDAQPTLAQMVFPREVCDPSEKPNQLQAVINQASFWGLKPSHTWHDFLFSMVPCLIPRRVLELGWPAGPIGVGNEAGKTKQLFDEGYVFGAWGHPGDEPYVRHIGYAVRSQGWAL